MSTHYCPLSLRQVPVLEWFDLVILGSGSAACAAAIKASELGGRTAMIERGVIGGTCVNVGCVPSKRLLSVGETYYYSVHNNFDGIALRQVSLRFSKVVEQKSRLVNGMRRKKYVEMIKSLAGVTLFRGNAAFVSPKQVKIEKDVIQGEKFIVATGSTPNILNLEGIEKVEYLTNVEALDLEELPDSMIVLGGRALAVEFAQMYAHFGTRVTLLQRSPRIVPEEEPEISQALAHYLLEEGIGVYTAVKLLAVRRRGKLKVVTAEVAGKRREFRGDQLLMATGRRPNTTGLGLDKAGVELGSDGAVKVDEQMRTSASHIWAAGDVTGKPMLETVAAKEGAIAADNALKAAGKRMDFSAVPHAVFTSPQVASVGLTEEEMMKQFKVCACRVLPMSLVPKASIMGDERGLIKMVINPQTKQILGVHILAHNAADLIHEATLAVKSHLTIDEIVDTVHVFPTMSESIKLVAQSFHKDVSKLSCCTE
jgi:mercuric reductase